MRTFILRATISDPFGYYDISAAQFTLRDGAGNVSVAPLTMVVNAVERMCAKKYYCPTVPPIASGSVYTRPSAGTTPAGNWTTSVTASEGTEKAISDTGRSVFNVQQFPPLLNVIETIDDNTVNPGQIITDSIEIKNINSGEGYSLVVSGNIDLRSGITPKAAALLIPLLLLSAVTPVAPAVALMVVSPMPGASGTYSSFFIKYQVQLR